MSGHTKGPWSFRDDSMTGAVWAGKEFIASVFPNAPDGWDGFSDYEQLPEMRANARLIAAAPDGLAFAESHDAYMLEAGYSGPDDAALHPKAAENWRQCRAFIIRATEAQP